MVKYVANRVAVMYLGKIVETGNAEAVMLQPQHPYTQELINAVPAIGKPLSETGLAHQESHSVAAALTGCSYRPRCRLASSACAHEAIAWREYRPGHLVACMEVKQNE